MSSSGVQSTRPWSGGSASQAERVVKVYRHATEAVCQLVHDLNLAVNLTRFHAGSGVSRRLQSWLGNGGGFLTGGTSDRPSDCGNSQP